MKFSNIKINNFRQYYKTVDFDLSTNDDKNIVVIEINPDANSERIAQKLKTNKLNNIHVININKDRQSNSNNWIDSLALLSIDN